jgi:hypothetical protein
MGTVHNFSKIKHSCIYLLAGFGLHLQIQLSFVALLELILLYLLVRLVLLIFLHLLPVFQPHDFLRLWRTPTTCRASDSAHRLVHEQAEAPPAASALTNTRHIDKH